MAPFLIEASRWLFLCVLLGAPWAYGCTLERTIALLNVGCGLILALWLAGLLVGRKALAIEWVNAACVVWLIGQGWMVALNAQFRHDPKEGLFHPMWTWWEDGPGTVDGAVSVTMMWRVTALLGMLLYVGDLARRAVWRRRIRQTVILAGASVILFGIVQRALGAHAIFWVGKPTTSAFFATFYYSGNAGAFINLVLPIVAGAAVLALGVSSSRGQRTVALPALGICLAGGCVNASRAAFVVMCALALAWVVWMARTSFHTSRWSRSRALSAVVSVLALGAIISCAGWEAAVQKWTLLPQQLNADNPRLLAAWACVRMLPDAGFWGFGPGTFELTFPHYTHFLGASIPGTWRFAHNDYLQALIEWGWVGAAALGILLFRGIAVCFFRSADAARAGEERGLLFSIGLALAGIAIHATIDFPLQIASLQFYVVTFLGMAAASGQADLDSRTVAAVTGA